MQIYNDLNYMMKQVTIFTDGACSGNPGPGGYGVVLIYNGKRKELSQGFLKTTNNRMELRAVIAGLVQLKEKCRVFLYTDSKYIVDAINRGWVRKWQKKNWMRNQHERALNSDLWGKILLLLQEHDVSIFWIRGHSGNAENEYCDKLAVAAINGENLIEDRVS
jgi:ribonuclease HI